MSYSRFLARVLNNNHMYDATEIFRTLGGHKKETFFKLAFYLLSFFYYLYRCVCLSSFLCFFRSFVNVFLTRDYRMIVALIADSE